MSCSVIALIPARSGSKSIKAKNLALLGGYPLLAYSSVAAGLAVLEQTTRDCIVEGQG